MDQVHIQAQDTTGMWRTYHTTTNDSQRILQEMQSLKARLPDFRIRAVDNQGKLVDMLG